MPARATGARPLRHHPAQLRQPGGRAHRPAGSHRDELRARLQPEQPRRARVPSHERPPSPYCPHRAAELGQTIRAAQRTAATPPLVAADPAPRWRCAASSLGARAFWLVCCRETVRAALHRLKLSWKKAKKLLGRADPERRQAFIEQLQGVLDGAQRDQHLLVYVDEAHIHQDADLGYGWAERGQRLWVASSSPGLSARVSSLGCTCTTRARYGSGPTRAPMVNTRSMCCSAAHRGARAPADRTLGRRTVRRTQAVREVPVRWTSH